MRYISLLGRIASFARRVGMGRAVAHIRDTADSYCLKVGLFPLRVRVEDDIELYGLFRHRSFLAGIQKGYEPYFRRLFLEAVRPGIVVVDGGAHIGLYSVLASKRVGVKGKVLSFEPDPFNFAALHFNLKRNGCRNVIPLAKALSSQTGQAVFYSSYGTISSSLFKRFDCGLVTPINVEVTTLDNEFLNDSMDLQYIVIKLDIEGAEPLVIQGMRRTIERVSEAVLFLEINPQVLRAGGYEPAGLVRELQSLGFELWFIDEMQCALVPVQKLSAWCKGNLYGRLSK